MRITIADLIQQLKTCGLAETTEVRIGIIKENSGVVSDYSIDGIIFRHENESDQIKFSPAVVILMA